MTTLQQIFGQLIIADRRLSAEECQQIICDYACLLDSDGPLPGCVADASRLPHSKDTIKIALLTCMVSSGGDDELMRHLRHGYLMLAAFQEHVGGQTLGMNFTAIDLKDDPQAVVFQLQRQARDVAPWKQRVAAEQEQLLQELRAAGVEQIH
ncbi:MAG: hypothetical protein AAGI11_09685 [Pseudomonadota bacterium]